MSQGTIDFSQISPHLQQKADQIAKAIEGTIPTSVGMMLVEGFKRSFDLQRFNDTGAAPWIEVKRRTPGSSWYGFNYKTNYKAPKGARSAGTGAKGGKSNFSTRATTRAILLGSGSANLRDSIYLHTAKRGRIIITSDQPHALVHNEGGKIKVFGRTVANMPKRQFMGASEALNKEARAIIDRTIYNIL